MSEFLKFFLKENICTVCSYILAHQNSSFVIFLKNVFFNLQSQSGNTANKYLALSPQIDLSPCLCTNLHMHILNSAHVNKVNVITNTHI